MPGHWTINALTGQAESVAKAGRHLSGSPATHLTRPPTNPPHAPVAGARFGRRILSASRRRDILAPGHPATTPARRALHPKSAPSWHV